MPASNPDTFNQYRPLLFSIAYRMLGSAADAEDVVQDAYLRWQSAPESEVRSPRSYLATVVTRLCIDQLRSARAQREVYVGPWLPEPILTGQAPDMTSNVELAETLSLAFMLVLETLGPVERAVFLLREVFSYSYPEIAHIVGKTEANCRQMVKRAQEHLRERRPRYTVTREQQERITERFIDVCAGGDMVALLSMLSPEVKLITDSGGKVQAARNVLSGQTNVAKFIFGVLGKLPLGSKLLTRITEVNGQPGILAYADGVLIAVMVLDYAGEQIIAVNAVMNPDKLAAIAADAL